MNKYSVLIAATLIQEFDSEYLAMQMFDAYCKMSRSNVGRAANKEISLMENAEVICCYKPL